MRRFGLLGYSLQHSFSPRYFSDKFLKEHIQAEYIVFDSQTPNPRYFFDQDSDLMGMNVTIPHKESVIPYLDYISEEAKIIGAVNTIRRMPDQSLMGYNTDAWGFEYSFRKIWQPHQQVALILGNGGAAKAVRFVLEHKMGVATTTWTRNEIQSPPQSLTDFDILIQTTPVGTFPNIHDCLPIDFSEIKPQTSVVDLIYNPRETVFLQMARLNMANTQNGYEMLIAQAEESWRIWNGI